MGIESFFLNIRLKRQDSRQITQIVQKNEMYRRYISYSVDEESGDLCVQAAMVCFFPACRMIYDLCCELHTEMTIVSLSVGHAGRAFDFADHAEFLMWMYRMWDEKIEYFRKDWGDFLISPADYYDSRSRLRQYYVKYEANEV